MEETARIRGSLQRRIVASVLLGLAVVLVGIAVLVGLAVTQSLRAALTERLAVAYAKEHEMAQEIDDALSMLTRIAALPMSPASEGDARGLTALLGATGEFTAHAIVDRQGRVIFQAGHTLAGDRASAPWLPPPARLRSLLAGGRPVVFGGQGRPLLIFATPMQAAPRWLVAAMDSNRLVRHLTAEHSVHGTYEAELLTETGSVAAGFPTSEGVSAHAELVAGFAARREAGVVAHRVPGGAAHYVAYVPLQSLPGWGVILEQPRDIVVALPQRLWRWMMGIGLFVLVAGAAVAWFDVRRVVTPLRQLASHAERFGRGDLETGIQIDREDEIGLLGKTLEEMRMRLRAAQAEVRSLSALTERERIARELHDGLAQALGIIYAQARAAEEDGASPDAGSAAATLHEIASISAQAYEEVRQSIFGLRTMVARRLGLVPALTEYLHEFSEHTDLRVELIVPDAFPRLALEVEAQLIRIVQEALTNVWRHAQASHAWVRFAVEGDRMHVMIEDDGIGFDGTVAVSADVTRFGLEAMRERAESIGGRLQVDSAQGRGTRVSLMLPLAGRG